MADDRAPEPPETRSGATIFALSSGRLPSAIAIVRLSGPKVRDALRALVGGVPAARRASLRDVRDPSDGSTIDRGVVVFFPGPGTVTGEDVAELQLHGGRAVVEAAMQCCRDLGLRAAEPGEFTRRAYVNGIMDLTQAEGVADLIAAETVLQRRVALGQSRGSLSALYEGWRRRLVHMRGLVEAEIDFADEEIGETRQAATAACSGLIREFDRHLAAGTGGQRVRDGLEVVLTGLPNVGKSSLLNALAGQDVAIVTPEPGTTRDMVEVRLELAGVPVTIVDTAGRREVSGLAELEGIKRGAKRAEAADLVVELVDLTMGGGAESGAPTNTWRVGNKHDLIDSAPERSLNLHYNFCLSAKTGVGVPDFVSALTDWACNAVGPTEDGVLTRARHRQGVEESRAHLLRGIAQGLPSELMAEELRLAGDALGRVTGRIEVDDVLDVIFREFCIGK